MIHNIRVEGVVVLYNPELSAIDNIKSYINQLDTLYIIDNSEHPDEVFLQQLRETGKYIYIRNIKNPGVAWALNHAAALAIGNGAHWLLTMDQDSKFMPEAAFKLIDFAVLQDSSQVGLVSPFHETAISVRPQTQIDEVLTTMTSGNLVSLAAYKLIGGFDEDYFIDALDWDYCLRLNLHKLKVLRLNSVSLGHHLGNPSYHRSPSGKTVVTLNYNKLRRFYITRNKLIILAKYRSVYPDFCRQVIKSLKMDLKYVVLYEKQKAVKLQYMLKGAICYYLGHRGKLGYTPKLVQDLVVTHNAPVLLTDAAI
ncbi:glycosyltransferase [Mucilaginibacter sp. Bleaf8]|uniref:glycosyltransferase n=1 Tax=Mucilaginibacter sp. Bleaf8 TaxID=2834430 RepID=UPI001BD17C67|nr:glycosyltransferase [Mucilaginibacter sp. Bleaf8]MBS7566170.1 glycosyltransferase [Mucilaginibacter sp. Bleaf8]